MNLDRWQCQFFGDLRVLDGQCLVQGFALDPFGHQRARGDGRTAAVRLELGIFDQAIGADLDLQFHHVAARWRADHAGTDAVIALVESADVAWVFVVVQYFFRVSHFVAPVSFR